MTHCSTPISLKPESNTVVGGVRSSQNDMAGPPRKVTGMLINKARGTVRRIFCTALVPQTEVPEEHSA